MHQVTLVHINTHKYTILHISTHQYTSVYISTHQCTLVYISIHQYTSEQISTHHDTSVYIRRHSYTLIHINQYTSAHINTHQYTFHNGTHALKARARVRAERATCVCTIVQLAFNLYRWFRWCCTVSGGSSLLPLTCRWNPNLRH